MPKSMQMTQFGHLRETGAQALIAKIAIEPISFALSCSLQPIPPKAKEDDMSPLIMGSAIRQSQSRDRTARRGTAT